MLGPGNRLPRRVLGNQEASYFEELIPLVGKEKTEIDDGTSVVLLPRSPRQHHSRPDLVRIEGDEVCGVESHGFLHWDQIHHLLAPIFGGQCGSLVVVFLLTILCSGFLESLPLS